MTKNKILYDAYFKYTKMIRPSIPDHAICKPNISGSKNKEKVIKSEIVQFLKWEGWLGIIVDSSAHYNKDAGIYVKSETTTGTSDIIACIEGKFYAIELKRIYDKGKDRQSERQEKFEKRVTSAGGEYVIVNDFMTFYGWYKTIKI